MRNWITLVEDAQESMPVLNFPYVLHVGTLDAAQKRKDSHEGHGLSVSMHPRAWMSIASGWVSGDVWKLSKPDAQFLNVHELSRKQKNLLKKWGIANGWAVAQTLYRVSYFDDEAEENRYFDCDTREEAERESYSYEDCPNFGIREVTSGFVGTEKLAQRLHHSGHGWLKNPYDFLAIVYAEDVLKLDGVWWEDRLSPQTLSAPRGVIFPSRVSSFKVEPAQDSDADESDDEW